MKTSIFTLVAAITISVNLSAQTRFEKVMNYSNFKQTSFKESVILKITNRDLKHPARKSEKFNTPQYEVKHNAKAKPVFVEAFYWSKYIND